jgi:catechol 2,3-dioxygenase-like lactoylglutathione lyase family enzyme
MTIRGISHLTFVVRDLDRTARLFVEGLGAQEVYDSRGRNFSLSREKFVLLGGVWLAFMEGEPAERSYRHVAFEVDEAELPAYESRLVALGVDIRAPRRGSTAKARRCTSTTTTTISLSCMPERWSSAWRATRRAEAPRNLSSLPPAASPARRHGSTARQRWALDRSG